MYLAKALLEEIGNPSLTVNERASLRCRLARHQETAGDYEAASEALADLWQGVGARPMLEGLDDETRAQVLLRVGALTGWIGSAEQIEGSQEMAKDLISESARAFEKLGQRNKVGEARSDLALCYWRSGSYDEARITLQEALSELDESDVEQRAIAWLRRAEVERASQRLTEALRIYNEAAPLFDKVNDHYLKATFHNGLATTLKDLRAAENREHYTDRVLMEYAAASFHFEQAGHTRYQACVENNIGSLFGIIGKFEDAHEHLDRAQVLMTRLKDNVHLGQVDETRARVLLAEGRIVEAEKTARAAVRRLEKGDELSLLAEALTTHGIALVRLDHSDQARAALERAIAVAEQVGDFESAGVSALTVIELLGASLTKEEVWATIGHVGVLLEKTQEAATLRRLATAFRSLFLTRAVPAPPDWDGFSLKDAVRRYEAHLIKLALKDTDGKVTAAARLLGFRHHQSLITLISARHKELIETGARTAVRPRRSHLIVHPKRAKKKKIQTDHAQAASQISILHVEDNPQIAKLVNDVVASDKWRVELCADGYSALDRLTGKDHYDLLLIDNDISDIGGLELIKRVRTISHRRRTPIVILSGSDCEADAWRVGVDAFLKKPEQISGLPSTIARLLKVDLQEKAKLH
ncbi:MAG: two-component system, OmpR family, phosphate regulon response regulator PhoB [Blastocatellia bacterium]|jgi:CheY-like chemotaxis protein/tetratricopeptide (TPR) repeat protein|nr:two-component system, OmpR family, phosphate regulon response regulator PhoB [Blastocatellia bacterium]